MVEAAFSSPTHRDSDEHVYGRDKVDRYGWEVQDSPGKFELLDKGRLLVNGDYQRAESKNKILELARDWSWVACGAISVSKRGGRFWVIDGQHRVLAAKKRSDISKLPCLVFALEDVADEARGFLNANANRKPVSAVAKHRAAVVAEDRIAVELQAIFDEFGVTVTPTHDGNPDHISCVASAAKKVGENPDDFKLVFGVAIELARAGQDQLPAILLDGLWYLNRNLEGGLANTRLRKRLFDIGAVRLIEGANRAAAFFAKGGSKVWATGMLEVLNKGLQKRFAFSGDAI